MLVPAQAGVAQLVEQRICNPQVTGSSPIASSTALGWRERGGRASLKVRSAGVAERSMAADCKSAGRSLRWFKSIRPHHSFLGGSNSGVESQPSKLLVAGSIPVSRSMMRGHKAHVAQLVEHVLGKDGVTSSSLVVGSISCFELVLRRWLHESGVGQESTSGRGHRVRRLADAARVGPEAAAARERHGGRSVRIGQARRGVRMRLVTSRARTGT